MCRTLLALVLGTLLSAQTPEPSKDAIIARAKALELNTPYVPPPGDPLTHHASGLAKIVCSAVFLSGFQPEFAAENLGYFVSPYAERSKLGKPVVDRNAKEVHIGLPDGTRRTARYLGDQGCVTLPPGKTTLHYKPVKIPRTLPNASKQAWPMGDAPVPLPATPKIDREKIARSVEAAFENPEEMTAAFLVTWKGHIIGERYGANVTKDTPLESWSMGKSLIATLMGVLIQQGAYTLDQAAPIPEWTAPDDGRKAIRISDILRMSSGLRIKAPNDPDYDPKGTYPDHLYLYTGSENLFRYAATRPQQWPPNKVGRYRNTDPVLTSYLIRLAVEKRGEEYLSFPRRQLLDKLGMRTMVLETDPYGNFLTQGYELASARDWARLGNLYLHDGMWEGKRILPQGFAKFVSTPAPAWVADKQPEYGGFFWVNGTNRFPPLPSDTYYMAGAGGQNTFIVPSHDLVIVRMGHYKGSLAGQRGLLKALALLTAAVPEAAGSR